jgi:hypothetical protein
MSAIPGCELVGFSKYLILSSSWTGPGNLSGECCSTHFSNQKNNTSSLPFYNTLPALPFKFSYRIHFIKNHNTISVVNQGFAQPF